MLATQLALTSSFELAVLRRVAHRIPETTKWTWGRLSPSLYCLTNNNILCPQYNVCGLLDS
eukprot:SAG11_NODE_604_length_8248_cov_6.574251_11_plen_61_part_00